MPVFVPGVPKFTIQPPTTSHDRGLPSPSIVDDVARVWSLIQDERHLTAQTLLHNVQQRVADHDKKRRKSNGGEPESSSSLSPKRKTKLHLGVPHYTKHHKQKEHELEVEVDKVKLELRRKQAVIDKLEHRCRLFRKARDNLINTDGWIYASTHFGIKTYYRREADDSLSLQLQGEVKDVPLFEQICVLKEVDLHYKWSPFCSSSITIADLDKLDVVGWVLVGLPNFGLARDGCFRAIGCDNFMEDGTILIVGQGIKDRRAIDAAAAAQHDDSYLADDPLIEQIAAHIPPVPTRRGAGRMTIRQFDARIEVTSPTSAVTHLVANVDPNMSFLPQSLLEFVMKHLAGVLLNKLQTAARKAVKNPQTNEHARLMRQESDFYRGWLLPKFEALCKERGWEMPSVAAFTLTPEELAKDRRLVERKLRKASTFDEPLHHDEATLLDSMSVVHTTHSNPEAAMSGHQSDDSVSALSSKSAKTNWSNNPIVQYMKEMEQKIQTQKEEKIAATRQMASERLKPKSLPSAKEKRLEELRLAKARRLAQDDAYSGIASRDAAAVAVPTGTESLMLPAEILTRSQKVTMRLHRHGPFRRVLVMLSLASTMFAMLNPDIVARTATFRYDDQSSWYILLLEDVCTVLFLALTTVMHFVLCDVALVYAFDSLELGRKAGWQIKRYYSGTVRVGVMAGSVAIFVISIIKALGKLLLRSIIWVIWRGYCFAKGPVSNALGAEIRHLGSAFPSTFGQALTLYWQFQWRAMVCTSEATQYLAMIPARLSYHSFVRSNLVGRQLEFCTQKIIALVSFMYYFVAGFIQHVIDGFEGNADVLPWRAEAFDLARTLFTYTAVFLVTTLVLFNIVSRKPTLPSFRREASDVHSVGSGASGDADSTPPAILPKLSALSMDEGMIKPSVPGGGFRLLRKPSRLRKSDRSATPVRDRSIPEDAEVVDDTTPYRGEVASESNSSSNPPPHHHRRRHGLSRRRTASAGHVRQ